MSGLGYIYLYKINLKTYQESRHVFGYFEFQKLPIFPSSQSLYEENYFQNLITNSDCHKYSTKSKYTQILNLKRN